MATHTPFPGRCLPRRGAAWSVAIALAVTGCLRPEAPPTERLAPVVTAAAPLLNGIKATKDAGQVAHAGDLVLVGPAWPRLGWTGSAPEPTGPRDSAMAELRLAPGGSIYYGFVSDLGPAVEVPSARWLCEQLAGADGALRSRLGACAALLRRVRTADGRLVAFVEHPEDAWPIATFGGAGLIARAKADAMTSSRLVATRAGPLLLTTTRWRRAEGTWTGGALAPYLLGAERIVRLATLPLDEVDAREAAKVMNRTVSLSREGDTVRLSGERIEVDRADGRVLTRAVIQEAYDLGQLAERGE
ncbi:MAG TPA: hypothetical protein VGK67_00845 [Myxococcales bacterium]|jgi:hypothetical protein